VDGSRRCRIQPHGHAATAVGEREDQDRGEAKLLALRRDETDGLAVEHRTYTVRDAVESWLEHGLTGRMTTVTNRTILAIPALARRVRGMEEGHPLVFAENGKPIIARLTRCIDGKAGRRLLTDHRQLRAQLAENCLEVLAAEDRSAAAEAEARHRWIAADQESYL
jgi:bifunctional DNA-binding transcriptional regulator/antitoxin component of YhaV-PrlF toxin-antitoxin module